MSLGRTLRPHRIEWFPHVQSDSASPFSAIQTEGSWWRFCQSFGLHCAIPSCGILVYLRSDCLFLACAFAVLHKLEEAHSWKRSRERERERETNDKHEGGHAAVIVMAMGRAFLRNASIQALCKLCPSTPCYSAAA